MCLVRKLLFPLAEYLIFLLLKVEEDPRRVDSSSSQVTLFVSNLLVLLSYKWNPILEVNVGHNEQKGRRKRTLPQPRNRTLQKLFYQLVNWANQVKGKQKETKNWKLPSLFSEYKSFCLRMQRCSFLGKYSFFTQSAKSVRLLTRT